MPTDKLYWEDPFARTFESEGARVSTFGGRASIVLGRTLFYPEAGGQLGDTGTLRIGSRALRVDDTQVDEAGDIHHLVAEAPTADEVEGRVSGRVDDDRRRDHMSQHTAQHMLSRALLDVARAETVSARLGSTLCTIDVSLPDVDDRDLARAEELVNGVVMGDVLVRALFPTAAELAAMKLRREPKVATNVRIIEVEGFDLTPCGGTHCTRTGQVGAVVVAGTERYKGKLRLSFHAGRRALADTQAKTAALGALAREFTCGPLDVPAAVAKLRGDLKARSDSLSNARGELVALLADKALALHPADPSGAPTVLVMMREHDDLGMLRTLAGRLAAREDVVAFCAAPEPATGELVVVVQRGAKASFDCGRWLKGAAAKHGGRGGGRPERAEGRLPPTAELEKLARESF